MLDAPRRPRRPPLRTLTAPGDDLTAALLRFGASAITLAVAVFLTLAR